MESLGIIMTQQPWAWLLFALTVYMLKKLSKWRSSKRPLQPTPTTKTTDPTYSKASYYNIEPLPEFKLSATQPLKLLPFKPKFHMTMALETTTFSDLIPMDNTYLTRCSLRSTLVQTESHEVLACNPAAVPAVLELYTWLIGTYLPTRFPSLYTLTDKYLHNHPTGDILPLQLVNDVKGAETALEILGSNIDDEFLIMVPSSSPSTSSVTYNLEAFINCFPSGFNTRSKLNKSLSDIHSPVPGYAEKLQKSMDRYFAALPVGKIVKRANWSINTTGALFLLEGNHMTPAEARAAADAEKDIDLAKTVLRCERQTLHRLPDTGALVFAFKTYQYPIKELRDEGSGEVLAKAIEGLGLGSVPEITVYKRQVIWGEKVKAFLRGEIDA